MGVILHEECKCGRKLYGAERAIGVCAECVKESKYRSKSIPRPGYGSRGMKNG